MGVYLGYVEKKGFEPQIFYNFKPIAEVTDSQIIELSPADQEKLLPASEKLNINFAFSRNNLEDRRLVDSICSDKSLVVFEFTLADLQDNIKANGERNQTGYKVQAVELIQAGKIRRIDTAGTYYVVYQNELISDFSNDAIVEINVPNVLAGDSVFVEFNDFWAGPYEVGYREYTASYYIKPQLKENKYVISGYRKQDVCIRKLVLAEGHWDEPKDEWQILIPKKSSSTEYLDVIHDDTLIDGFRDSLRNGVIKEGKINIDDIPALLDRYNGSILSGSVLTEEIRKNRLNRLVNLLTSEADVDETLSTVTDFVCDLLVKYQSSPNVEEWLHTLLEKNPELIENLKSSRAISERMDQLQQNVDDLKQQRAELEEEIAERKAEADEIDKAAIEAKKDALLQMDAEYASLCEKLDSIKNTLGLVENISDFQRMQNYLQEEVDYLERHKSHLEHETSGLEIQFQQLISKPHEEMLGIAFDGFMASKMLHAASEWEAEESNHQRENLISRVNAIPAAEKSPDELVDYLCRTVQIVRPKYNRNTILNIAICMVQGFLTVFSGDPGCGKTSICNIFGDVLGLNKIAYQIDCAGKPADSVKRYIPVSVERGWTSKRDFIGYYNPLSKTFDKSNRRVFDALHQLDTEKRDGISKFPYLILLDEANLSPMEYYWSDFMNICDDLGPQSKVNLGEDYVFGIPETLHFLATINNDHTTETLSPRLIDRAWIILLPQQNNSKVIDAEIPPEKIDIISWNSLRNAFIPGKEACELSVDVQKIYDAIVSKLRECRFSVSPRIDRAIKRYWVVASKWFEMDDTKTLSDIIALDYAVAQRILPKITGNGECFEKWLDEFRSLCSNHGLNVSAGILKDIIDRGNQQMKYYQFFY